MQIEISIKAPELVSALCALASGLTNSGFNELAEAIKGGGNRPETITIEAPKTPEPVGQLERPDDVQQTADEVAPTKQREKDSAPPKQGPTLIEVRAKLAALSQAGKQLQVKKLIADLGGSKLTDIPAEKYPELLQLAALI